MIYQTILDGVIITNKNGCGIVSNSKEMEYHNCLITENTNGGIYVEGDAKFYKGSGTH